jgi:hypothetical protein
MDICSMKASLVQIFGNEYFLYLETMKIFANESVQQQRATLENVRMDLEEVYLQVNNMSDSKKQITNENLLWYIQKMIELRKTAIKWARENAVIS